MKYVGFFTAVLILYLAVRDYWGMLGDFTRSDVSARLICSTVKHESSAMLQSYAIKHCKQPQILIKFILVHLGQDFVKFL